MTETRVVICPYCGETQPAGERCRACFGLFEPLSRQATHNEMGPWYVRDRARPFQPGCAYETLTKLIERGQVTKYSVIRGPTTKQFWTVARHVPGVAHLLGFCHSCDAGVDPNDHGCPHCGVPFGAYLDRNHLGLPGVRPLPGEAPDDHHHDEPLAGGAESETPRMTPPGLSSFAHDEELLGQAERGTVGTLEPEASDSSGSSARSAFMTARAPDETARGDDWVASPAMRSMQRRLSRQQRTIRLLTVLVIVIAIGGALFNLLAVAGRQERRVIDDASGPVDASVAEEDGGGADQSDNR